MDPVKQMSAADYAESFVIPTLKDIAAACADQPLSFFVTLEYACDHKKCDPEKQKRAHNARFSMLVGADRASNQFHVAVGVASGDIEVVDAGDVVDHNATS